MFPFRYEIVKICRRLFTKHNSHTVLRFVKPNISHPVAFGSFENSNATSRRRIPSQEFETSDMQMSTRAASGLDSGKSGLGSGPGPGGRRVPSDCGTCGEKALQQVLQPSDGSASKCLDQGYGKALKPPRRSLLNFCKRLVRIKEKPSNCPPCPIPKPEECFWDYLFKFDDKTIPEPSTCRIAQRNREACRKTDPRLSDPRYSRTKGDVLVFTEPAKTSCRTSSEPQPSPPPIYAPPKAVACRRLAEAASSPYPVFSKAAEDEVKVEARCSGPREFRVPFEECRPLRRPRESFSCEKGVSGAGVAPPVSIDRGTCGGRSVGEILAEATISRVKPSPLQGRRLETKCEPSVDVNNSSRIQRLKQLTKAANSGKEISKGLVKPS